ncbi:MAG: DHA2 family efflux MFS transporter permease subunit [Alphaproteobacteria bacterium]|nr:DHA2 family efflux MFS transporter permease subunit [Alphaproteobacteria bacterium]
MSAIADATPSSGFGSAAKWLATATVLCGMLASILSSTMTNVAIPEVMGAFGVGQDQAHWLSTGFLAASTASMPTVAWLRDRFGARAIFIGAMAVFSLAALAAESADAIEMVILARVVQGACAGISQPLALMTIFQLFPPNDRGLASGIFGMGVILGPALGPTFGGLIVDEFGWRYVFLGSLPMCALGIMMALVFLPGRDPSAPRSRFDWIGLALIATGVTCLLNALSNGQRWGWESEEIVVLVVVAILALIGLVAWEHLIPNPMLNMALYRVPRFACASVVAMIFGAGMFGSMYLIPLFAQQVQQLTPTAAGMMLMPAGVLLVFLFPISGGLADRVRPHGPIITGLLAFALAGYWLAGCDVNTSWWTMVFLVSFGRAGLAFVVSNVNSSALRALPPNLVGQGSGAINFIRMMGAAFGVNGLAFIIENRAAFHASILTATQHAGNPDTLAFIDSLRGLVAHAGLAGVERSGMAYNYLGQVIWAQATTMAFQDAFIAVSIIFLAAVAPAWLLGRGVVPPRARPKS